MIVCGDGISIYGQNPGYSKAVRQINYFVPEIISFFEDCHQQVTSTNQRLPS